MRVSSQRSWNGWLLLCVMAVVPLGRAGAQEPDETIKFGREAREGTPILDRNPAEPLRERERIHHVLSRLTFGVTPESIAQVEATGLKQWLTAQLEGKAEESALLRDHLAKLKSLPLSSQEIVGEYNRRLPNKDRSPEALRERAKLRRLRDVPRNELKDAVLLLAVYGDNQLKEVLCDFWRNHFNIDVSKGRVRYYATEYERDVIRSEALGTFERMLNKQARHPAMLVYLDNYVSRAAPRKELIKVGKEALVRSRDYAAAMEAVDIAKMRGINENYARELMELHTLGVDNYYTQADVVAVAHALTGWTVQQRPDRPIVFQFRADMHASEPRAFLRRRIPQHPGNPELEGQAILDLLARHKGTAQFIAYKLCRHLVDDHPPEQMVKRVAYKFRRKKTDLRAVYRAIINDKEFFNPKYYQSKFKRPFEYVVSALRVTRAEITSTAAIHRTLVAMSEPIYQCQDPTGYYDQADAWRDPGVMALRWQFGLGLGMDRIRGVRIPASFWEELEPNSPDQWKAVLTARILPGGCTEKTSEALDKVVAEYAKTKSSPEQLGRYIVGILLGSPEFQRQ